MCAPWNVNNILRGKFCGQEPKSSPEALAVTGERICIMADQDNQNPE